MSYWRNKTVLITGGSAGLGLQLARALATEGARLAVCGRGVARLEQAADSLRGLGADVLAVPADVATAGQTRRVVDQTVERFGGLDCACACAGQSMRGAVVDTPRSKFEELLAVNFLAPLDLAHAAGPHLEAVKGHLVLIGSLATKAAPKHIGAYPASKHPLAALAQQLRLERGPEGLHVLLVCPGPIQGQASTGRYDEQAEGLPEAAKKPGGGAKVKLIDPEKLARKILTACEQRKSELVIPKKARLLFAAAQLSPALGDWLISKNMGE
ncbi:MAG: SDR family NAD(P)-dependent oxidoreductase [Planctomycetales bacterium]|nr:SDR family NAD(P)-dependent oxidoreductase [Planctomycetales bacterium]